MNKTKYNRKYNKGYNYSGGIRCNDMKPMERKFFRYMIRQINYNKTDCIKHNMAMVNKTIRYHANYFSDKYNVPYKQLMYYLDKWSYYDIYAWGTSLDTGWFINIDKLCTLDVNNIPSSMINYADAMPNRVLNFLSRINKITL